jgi:ribosomal protein S18 acetylase RimI-like enzyme
MKRAGKNQKQLVIDILAESFDQNRSVNYVVKQDEKRRQRIRTLMSYSFDVCNAFGDVWLYENKQACALVVLPDKKRTTFASMLWDAQLAVSVIGLSRVGQVLGRESKIKSFHPKEPFAYLWFIGVKSDMQGKGIGGALLNELIAWYSDQKRPIYLETSVDLNLPWYKYHGFEIFNTIELSYSLYLLRRSVQ